MYRCVLPLMLAVSSLAAQAQMHRFFPVNALRGDLVVTQYPDVTVNGQAARIAPGGRIRNADNLLAQPASITNQKLTVHYTVEASTGLLMDVWVLNSVELANKPWPTTRAEAASWKFDPGSQTWTK